MNNEICYFNEETGELTVTGNPTFGPHKEYFFPNNNEEKELSIDDFPGLKAIKEELIKKGWKKVN